MRDLLREGLRLGEELARLPWEATRRLTRGKSETVNKAADLGEHLGRLPFRAARALIPGRTEERRAAPGPDRPGAPQQRPEPGTRTDGGGRGGGGTIVVLGAGYAGLSCYLELQDHLGRDYDLVLVNADKHHWFTTELHTYVAGESEDAVRIPLSRIVTSPGRLVVDRVSRLVPDQRQVELASGRRLNYDLLVFALGSDPEYYGLPGVAENSLIVGNWQAATQLRERVARLLESGDRDGVMPHVVVAGGGLTGVEVAGELADEYPGGLRLSIVEAGPEIMAGFDPHLVKVSREVLSGKGIKIMTGDPIARVEPGVIHFKKGDPLPCDLLVWAGGVRGSALLKGAGLAVTPRGRARVDAFLRAEGHPEIYVLGDSAAAIDPATGREVGPTAQAAVQAGTAAGKNILRRLRGQAEQPFAPQIRGAFASLGRTQGIGQMGQGQFTGIPAMVIKHLVEAHHAWEAGAGVLPLVKRLLSGSKRFLRGSQRVLTGRRPVRVPPPAARPKPGQQIHPQ